MANIQTAGYLAAAILFIMSLGGLSQQETARRGNLYGILGMILAIAVTLLPGTATLALPQIGGALLVGAVIGGLLAARVAMTAMPELVAILHSFVGLAAVLVALATFASDTDTSGSAEAIIHLVEIAVAVAVGALTFTGSIVAWGKLSGRITGKALLLPGRHALNIAILVGIVVVSALVVRDPADQGMIYLLINAGLAAVLGVHLVLAIGGADMPVVVSLLNSYSGWAAAAAGFMLSNDLLIVTGALVGSSGAILSIIMCRGMNRSIVNVIFGSWGAAAAPSADQPVDTRGVDDVISAAPDQVGEALRGAQSVVIVPGYGMAVAKAQHSVSVLTRKLRERGCQVSFGIHPVAGRMPGHMNVLLAEADIPYDIVHEMEEVNPDLEATDVVLVIGANDIVNPDALQDASSPIYGMPQLEVWHARRVVVLKRSMSPGYAGVQNPLFFRDNTWMLFGDASNSVDSLIDEV